MGGCNKHEGMKNPYKEVFLRNPENINTET